MARKCFEEPKSVQQRRNAARQSSYGHTSEVLYLWATVGNIHRQAIKDFEWTSGSQVQTQWSDGNYLYRDARGWLYVSASSSSPLGTMCLACPAMGDSSSRIVHCQRNRMVWFLSSGFQRALIKQDSKFHSWSESVLAGNPQWGNMFL